MSNVLSIFLVICGVLYVALSGSAEGFISLRILILPVMLLAFVRLLFLIVRSMIAWVEPKFAGSIGNTDSTRTRIRMTAWISSLFVFVALFGGTYLDRQLIAESMKRGDTLVLALARHKTQHGRCPERLEGEFAEFRPALRNSEFELQAGNGFNDCLVGFRGPSFWYCARSIRPNGKWHCDD